MAPFRLTLGSAKHAHPTESEAFHEAALKGLGKPLVARCAG
jgi:hypothetical protein